MHEKLGQYDVANLTWRQWLCWRGVVLLLAGGGTQLAKDQGLANDYLSRKAIVLRCQGVSYA